MADGWKRSHENTNIDNDTISPPLTVIYLLLGQMKLAQAQHRYITTMWKQNHFIRLTATHSLEKTKPASSTPLVDEEWLDEKQAGEEMAV